MKTIKFFSFLVLSFLLISCKGQEQKETKTQEQSISKIEVIDFHSTHRCMTCNAIEANTKYTLDTYFSNELKSGQITFQVVNVDEKENEAIAEKFEATGTALFFNLIKDGKETAVDLSEFAFMNARDKNKFSAELKSKLETELLKL